MRIWIAAGALLLAGMVAGCEPKKPAQEMTAPPPPPPPVVAQPLPPAPPLDEGPKPPIPPPAKVTPPAAARTTTPPPAAPGQNYVVQPKDTLWSIAKQQLGDGKRWKDIVALNPGLTAENLKAGQTIKIPAK